MNNCPPPSFLLFVRLLTILSSLPAKIIYYKMQFQMEKAYLLEHFQEYRIIQPQVVFIHGLPHSLSQLHVLQRQLSPLGSTLRITTQHLNKDFYSAFAQFSNEVAPALLIIMLNQLPLRNRSLRVFYGSTKFCPHFLKNHPCQLENCNYAHYYAPHLTHLRDQAKHIDHNNIAYIHIYQQLPQAIDIIQRTTRINEGILLPLAKQRLITLQYSIYSQYEAAYPQIEREQKQTEIEWTNLQKEIEQKAVSQAELQAKKEEEEDKKSSKVQQFLDAAERFLTKLIFESSVFVY